MLSALVFAVTVSASHSPLMTCFEIAAEAYYTSARECVRVHRRLIPSARDRALMIAAYEYSATRWWAGDPDAAYRLIALAHTEGGGSSRGRRADPVLPNYGPMHVGEREARVAGAVYGLRLMHRTGAWFRSTLKGNPGLAVEYAAGYLRICFDQAGGDWDRAVGIYKYGAAGLARAVNRGQDVKTLKVIGHYHRTLDWIMCLRQRPTGCECNQKEKP